MGYGRHNLLRVIVGFSYNAYGVFLSFYPIGMTLSFFSRYVAPLPGVVSVDGSALPTAAMQVIISA